MEGAPQLWWVLMLLACTMRSREAAAGISGAVVSKRTFCFSFLCQKLLVKFGGSSLDVG